MMLAGHSSARDTTVALAVDAVDVVGVAGVEDAREDDAAAPSRDRLAT